MKETIFIFSKKYYLMKKILLDRSKNIKKFQILLITCLYKLFFSKKKIFKIILNKNIYFIYLSKRFDLKKIFIKKSNIFIKANKKK